MIKEEKPARRRYHAPQRQAAAARTREAIVQAATHLFEERGWAGTTIRSVSDSADVSPKTVEALFGTKAALLKLAVDYAIRGDLDPQPMPQRSTIAHIEAAPDAPTMLKLHAVHLRTINQRSARIAWTVEHAAASDPAVHDLWQQMNHNRAYAVHWATNTLLAKPGHKPGLTKHNAHPIFWIALDWGTYRTLTEHAHLNPNQYETWLRDYYQATLLPNRTT